MNLIEVTGGKHSQRAIAHKVTEFVIAQLMPRMRTLDITVNLVDIKSDAIGYCCELDDNRTFEIEVDKKLGVLAMASTLAHELVHVKQYARREMNGVDLAWKKQPVPADTPYMELPWEVEAYAMEKDLLNKMVDNDLF